MAKVPRDRAFAMSILFTGHGPTTFAGKQHDLHGAKLPELMLENAEMPGVILDYANLYGAVLKKANLNGASLVMANLEYADLSGAYLIGADLRDAILKNANLSSTDLTEAKIDGVNQLARAGYLYEVSGLTPEVESELRKHHSHLFRKPPE